MKKSFKVLAIAAIASMTFVACNNNKPAEPETDTTAIEMIAEDEMVAEPAEVLDTTPVVEEQKAAPAKAKTTAQKPAAKPAAQGELKPVEEGSKLAAPAEEGKKLEAPSQKASKLKNRR